MKNKIQSALGEALKKIAPELSGINIEVSHTADPAHGDFASNVALKNAKTLGLKPRELAEKIIAEMGNIDGIGKLEIAGAGFINIYLASGAEEALLKRIIQEGADFGKNTQAQPKKILLEFVSANPNGPLHVGHGRGAGYGSSLAQLLRTAGYQVDCEYYVNDAGRQMDILALSVYWRYLQALGWTEALPLGVYQGDYVIEIGKNLAQQLGDKIKKAPAEFLPDFENTEEQRDNWIDFCIARLKALLGADYETLFNAGLSASLTDIQNDLGEFGVEYQRYYSEKSLFTSGKIQEALQVLKDRNETYEKDGALWFKASQYGDEKDRVIQRENGITTYFASDIAYHLDKYQRGYDVMIDIFGADHHGYMARVKASLQALGLNPEQLEIMLVQFAVLYEKGEKVQMSTRAGQFVTLRQLRETVGNDACRFFYIMRAPKQHLDFDLDLATAHSKDNPFYYVEYAHARTCRVLERAQEEGITFNAEEALPCVQYLTEAPEKALLREMNRYGEVIKQSAEQYSPHMVINYLKDLATLWHQYYDAGYKVLHEDAKIRQARLLLTTAVRQVLKNALNAVGLSAWERM